MEGGRKKGRKGAFVASEPQTSGLLGRNHMSSSLGAGRMYLMFCPLVGSVMCLSEDAGGSRLHSGRQCQGHGRSHTMRRSGAALRRVFAPPTCF